jgi:hypothetical protein
MLLLLFDRIAAQKLDPEPGSVSIAANSTIEMTRDSVRSIAMRGLCIIGTARLAYTTA